MKSDWRLDLLLVLGLCGVVGLVLAATFYSPTDKQPFVPMELACVDAQGQAATKDTSLRYTHSGPTIVGVDEAGYTYLYTPPRGWVCRFGEIKKP